VFECGVHIRVVRYGVCAPKWTRVCGW
jgi:hypothetical protein